MSTDCGLFWLPNEILARIISFCDLSCLPKLEQTCTRIKRCVDAEIVWMTKWKQLTKGSNIPVLQGADYRRMCQRFVKVFGQYTSLEITTPSDGTNSHHCPKCVQCLSCTSSCIQDRDEIMIFDFGSKTTWFKYASESTGQLSMHPTVAPSQACGEQGLLQSSSAGTEKTGGANVNCPVCTKILNKRIASGAIRSPLMLPSNPAAVAKDANQSPSLGAIPKRSSAPSFKLSLRNLYCFDTAASSTEDENVLLFKVTGHGEPAAGNASIVASSNDNPSSLVTVTHHCTIDGDNQNPLNCKKGDESFVGVSGNSACHCLQQDGCKMESTVAITTDVCAFLIRHMLRKNPFFQPRNIPFVLCEPIDCTLDMKVGLVTFVFTELKVPGVCFIPKAVATALYGGLDTCLIIDSGAHNTVVAPVVDLQVLQDSVQHRNIGGSHLSRQLADCMNTKGMAWQVDEASVASSQVKKDVYLAYNATVESRKKLPPKTLHVKGFKNGERGHHQVSLSHELYQVAEDLYLNMELPSLVARAVQPLEPATQRRLLSNIVLTGGNSRLAGLALRLTRDLEDQLPSLSSSIHVMDPRVMTGRTDAVIGASYIRKWPEAHWITRQDYVVYGAEQCVANTGLVHSV